MPITTEEYLEKLMTDAFKRESDQEENVVRTLPFFATSLALVATTVGLLRTEIPLADWSPYSVFVYGCFLAIAVTVAVVLILLLIAVRPRKFAYPAQEQLMIDYAQGLRAHHKGTGLSDNLLEAAVVSDLRQMSIEQFAKAATNSRETTQVRLLARSRAATALVINLAFAFLLVAGIVVHSRAFDGGSNTAHTMATDSATISAHDISAAASKAPSSTPNAPTYEGGGERGVDLERLNPPVPMK